MNYRDNFFPPLVGQIHTATYFALQVKRPHLLTDFNKTCYMQGNVRRASGVKIDGNPLNGS
jgi:hypothetical protein